MALLKYYYPKNEWGRADGACAPILAAVGVKLFVRASNLLFRPGRFEACFRRNNPAQAVMGKVVAGLEQAGPRRARSAARTRRCARNWQGRAREATRAMVMATLATSTATRRLSAGACNSWCCISVASQRARTHLLRLSRPWLPACTRRRLVPADPCRGAISGGAICQCGRGDRSF